jgi:hypothetical protein
MYIPVTPATPPNPNFAQLPERDITTPSGKKLTLIYPGDTLPQLPELGENAFRISSHLTSLKPLNPKDAPDAWERNALLAFEKGQQEVSSLMLVGKEKSLRLIRPLITKPECLTCHGKQGYQVGDIRGGISVSIPWKSFRESLAAQLHMMLLTYGGILGIGLLGLYLGNKQLQTHLAQRKRAEEALEAERKRLQQALDEVKTLRGIVP